MIVAKLRGARERVKAKSGRCEGRKPYGTFDGSAIITRIIGLRATGLPYESIATGLNREGVKPRYEGNGRPALSIASLHALQHNENLVTII